VLLEGKNAVIYGSGHVGTAVARSFAREGARVFLAGRTLETLERMGEDISGEGGQVSAQQVDVLDGEAVNDHADAVAAEAGAIDVAFNAIGHGDVHGRPLIEMSFEDFARPVVGALKAQFLITGAVARHMVKQGSGVVLTITATTARPPVPEVGGTAVRFDATEGLCRQWASELGPYGVRVVWLRTTGLPEAVRGDRFPGYGTGSESMTRAELIAWLEGRTMLKRLTSLTDVGNAAAFAASDAAGALTAGAVNLSCGSVPNL